MIVVGEYGIYSVAHTIIQNTAEHFIFLISSASYLYSFFQKVTCISLNFYKCHQIKAISLSFFKR